MRCEADEAVILLGREDWSHFENVVKDSLLQFTLGTMDFLYGRPHAFGICLVRHERFSQFFVRLTNRCDKFIPAPSELRFDRFKLVLLL